MQNRGKQQRAKARTTQTGKKTPIRRAASVKKRKIACANLPLQRQFSFGAEGQFFDLQEVFDKVQARYFPKRLANYTILWGKKRRQAPKTYFVFGTIQEEDRVIRIHPLLDQRWVPGWFLEYVVYHEMLHAVVPDRYTETGRRVVHHDAFLKRERSYHWFNRAQKWEKENLARFLR